MRILVCIFIFTISFNKVHAWGSTGHRVIGLIAEKHLSRKARKKIKAILGNETLAEVSTYMDFIRSNPKYDYMVTWHYATIPDGETYSGAPEKGDAVQAIKRLVEELKSKNFTYEDEVFNLKCLVHLIGDIHQPLHVGNGKDRGGNDFKVQYFWRKSNLHRVWDEGLISEQKYSYTEYTDWINHPTDLQLKNWSSLNALDWAKESQMHRQQVYNTVKNKERMNYKYNYNNISLLNERLLQAGIRLANVLNDIYG